MSMAISRAKYTGDPGFLDFLKKGAAIATSFIPFAGPTISQAIASLGSRKAPQQFGPGSVPLMQAMGGVDTRCSPTAFYDEILGSCRLKTTVPNLQERAVRMGLAPQNGQPFPQIPIPGIVGATQRLFPGGATGMMAAPNGVAMVTAGYHPNKTDYFLKSGEFVPAGTRMVKNRKRNPANARATSRAISRISGAKTYAKSLGRISIRKKC